MNGIVAPLADLYNPIRSDLREVARIFDGELVSDFRSISSFIDRSMTLDSKRIMLGSSSTNRSFERVLVAIVPFHGLVAWGFTADASAMIPSTIR